MIATANIDNNALTVNITADNDEQASEFATLFPKSTRLDVQGRWITFRAAFRSNATTDNANEASVKRTKRFVATLAAQDIPLTRCDISPGSYEGTVAEFLATQGI